MVTYTMDHTPGGMPNINMHYPLPWFESEDGVYKGLADHLKARPLAAFYNYERDLVGSVGDDLQVRFVNPFETGWGKLVRFDHDFVGKTALEKISKDENQARQVVTLEWNADDIAEVYKTQFQGNQAPAADPIDARPADTYYQLPHGRFVYHADKVLDGDKTIGISVMRDFLPYYQRMISLAFIDRKYYQMGKELTVLWGRPGTRQMKIRAVIARYPYNDNDNKNVNVNKS